MGKTLPTTYLKVAWINFAGLALATIAGLVVNTSVQDHIWAGYFGLLILFSSALYVISLPFVWMVIIVYWFGPYRSLRLTTESAEHLPIGKETDIFCRKCSYNLRQIEVNRCPECGQSFSREDPESFSMQQKGHVKWYYWMTHVMVAISSGCFLLIVLGFFLNP